MLWFIMEINYILFEKNKIIIMILRLLKLYSLEMNFYIFLICFIMIFFLKECVIFKGGGVRSNLFIFYEGYIIFFYF